MTSLLSPPTEEAVTIPENVVHAVSVSLPTWKHNIAYEEGDEELASKMKSGYPRFKIHYKIEEFAFRLENEYGREHEKVMILSTSAAARRCREFIQCRHPEAEVRVLQLSYPKTLADSLDIKVSAVFFPKELFKVAKQYWQHTGEGISSRTAQYFLERLDDHDAKDNNPDDIHSISPPQETFVEERFGRNLSVTLADEAKDSLKARIAHEISRDGKIKINAEHVWLYPTGMTAIFSAYRIVMEAFKTDSTGAKAVCFGFPYTDTLKILEKWGPGVIFYPFGDDDGDLVKFENQLRSKEINISCLVCEVPSNPLLNTPNLIKIHHLSQRFNFVVIVDDTVGNMANVDVISYADICVSSLTKIFSGDCNVMAGDLVLNPQSRHYALLKSTLEKQYVDAFWAEDAIYLERNSRDFFDRNQKVNANAEALVELLVKNRDKHPSKFIKDVNYPKLSKSRANYDALKHEYGGYSGLLSVVFYQPEAAIAFYDSLFIAKGPSLGTNFTLACPYTVIAHYNEFDFATKCGVDPYLVRISVGLEETEDLLDRFQVALDAAEHAVSG